MRKGWSGAGSCGVGRSEARREETHRAEARGRFIWPSPADGVVAITAAQLGYMLEGIDWRHPLRTWRPELAG